MKKLLSLLLALTMMFALASCGSSDNSSSSNGNDGQSAESATSDASGTNDTADTPSDDGNDDTFSVNLDDVEPLEIMFNSTYNENEANGLLMKQFESYLEELSGGKITLNILWGGTVFDETTQFTALRDGAVDMISIQQMADADYIPYMNFCSYGIGSDQNVMDLWNYIIFENEETSSLIMEEAAENNMLYLNTLGMGVDCIASNFEWSTLDELVAGSQSLGAGDTAKFEAMGMNCAFVAPPMTYDALQRGICDTSCLSLAGMYSMSWDEVAPNVVIDQLWACGGNFTVNLDFWNGLSEAQQSIIKEAAMRTGEYSLKMNADEEADQIAAIEARSNTTVKYLSDEDAATFFGYVFDTNADNSLNRVAGDAEKTANMTMILETVADYYGYDWEH